jgi:hypothetical protein
VLVTGDDLVAGLKDAEQRLGLGRLAGLARLDLQDLDGTQAQGPAGRAGAAGVVLGQGRLGRAAQPAYRSDGDPRLRPRRRSG